MTNSLSSNLALVPLKSKRVPTSRVAWSTAFATSWAFSSETTSKEGMRADDSLLPALLREQSVDLHAEFAHVLFIVPAGSRPGEAGMDVAHLAVSIEQDRGRKAIDAAQARQ